ncbi:hypothetical protein [Mycoplasmopsis bovis]|uniref:hypothetical protein n=1 Tax=Mycoplasmopsis bovis TaxID=28903 RepID=UPI00059E98F1|nr:hypothetical protein [Mycoplasmopsis bovis]WHL47916.1 hypothetical protein HYE50_04505 [Mycoplasmopsis bovis]WMX53147.1 hypothetical protein HYE47_04720 [Mycoplasmopsis bovis]WMX53171.1 hypothetical protein HYE47_04820 [Mycoplasmopsis bovis]WMX76380.1 hypothetical protein HYE46_04700 [Mycoplasmopsis bovis]
MAKQLSVNEWKYLFEKYEKHRSGELTKKCFLNEMMKIKNVKHIFCTWTFIYGALKELERHLNRFIDWYN